MDTRVRNDLAARVEARCKCFLHRLVELLIKRVVAEMPVASWRWWKVFSVVSAVRTRFLAREGDSQRLFVP